MLTFVYDLTVMPPTVLGVSPLQADGLSSSMSAMRHPPFSPAFDIELLLQHVLFLSFAVSQNDTDAPSTAPVATTTHGHAFSPLALAFYLQATSNNLSVIYSLKICITRFAEALVFTSGIIKEPATFVPNCSINMYLKTFKASVNVKTDDVASHSLEQCLLSEPHISDDLCKNVSLRHDL